jgi:hypothetical protein
MAKPIRIGGFWACLAMMYLVLAGVSLHYSRVYDSKISKAPTVQGTAQGATRYTSPMGTVEILRSGGQGDVVVTDLWKDLRAYLNVSTWVNVVGFVLAAMAAFWSGRQSDGKITGES